MAKNVLWYLVGTLERKLVYRQQKTPIPCPLSMYSDASFANCFSDRRNFPGSIAFYLGCPIAWTCTKQPVVPLSTTEAKSISLTRATPSLTWIQQHLAALRCQPANGPTARPQHQLTLSHSERLPPSPLKTYRRPLPWYSRTI
jgi:hypothetical protein